MSTRLYLADATVPYSPATFKGAWSSTAAVTSRKLSTDKTDSLSGLSVKSRTAPNTNNYTECALRFVSAPLLAGTLAATAMDLGIFADEGSASLNAFLHVHVWVTQGDSDSVRGTVLADFVDSTELHVGTATGLVFSAPQISTPVTVTAGDRIVVELGYKLIAPSVTDAIDFFYGGGNADLVSGQGTGGAGASTWIDVPTLPGSIVAHTLAKGQMVG